jgi:hypothetical protein
MSTGGGGNSTSMDSSSAAPSGGGDGMGGTSSATTDSYNFLRGGWQTNENGIVTFNTIFPGFCELQLNSIEMKKLILFNRYWPCDSYSHYGTSKYHI